MELDPVVQKLVEDLVSSDDQIRITATRELASCGTLECIPALEKAMGDENFVVQASAEKAISQIRIRVQREREEAVRREKEERRLENERLAEEARIAAEEASREKEIIIEEVLSEEEIEKIRREEIKRIEIEKQQKAEELRRLEDQKQRDEQKLQLEEQKRLEEDRRKAAEMLRGKVRQETAKQKGLVEYNGEWLTEEEVKIREALRLEEEEKKQAAFRRARARKKKQNLTEIEKLISESETWFLKMTRWSLQGLIFIIVCMIVSFFVSRALISILFILLIVFLGTGVYMAYLLIEAEHRIYTLRIYEIEGETFIIKTKMVRGWIIDRIRGVALARTPELLTRFGDELKAKPLDNKKSGSDSDASGSGADSESES
ncbi:MAG: hypothetical protein CVV64_03210 [Candidatus Wallbacteria bacterium HGW-Wallbacteria-1]|jgi:hypothetical protein|uniref:HEAT repeat domain-containing protein n=1 Tax=Candidatus Wallbacteria bacterium HGW-Wallbacteria-1 TaxID=2013854 RepID=A0A2N1PTL8_9BACT|nr:MAG: hypothetical protein CVV64_03210 [Candidatus Wallbacteria bacterium HGW-Wallbacteria-1]